MVFLDISMPEHNGIEVLEYLLKKDTDANIIMFSGNKRTDVVNAAVKRGAKGYVVKPFKQETLMQYARKFAG